MAPATPFDLHRFALDLLEARSHAELLACARRWAAAATGQPAYALHVLPGQPWERATLVDASGARESIAAPVRSALFAVHRRLARRPGPMRLEDEEETAPIFRALLPGGPASLAVLPLRTRGGRLCGALVTGQPPGVEPEAATAALLDICSLTGPAVENALKNAQALRDQERMKLFSETTEESLWDWTIPQGEVWWGGNLDLLFDGQARALRRPDWRAARIHAGDAPRVLASFEAALQGSDSSWNAEYRIHGAVGAPLHVREHVYFLREVDGRPYRAIGTVRDVSVLQNLLERETAARAEAERVNLFKDDFMAMLGHELRNPLAPIVATLTLLERRGSLTPRHVEILRRQTQHLVRLVDDLLDVSRISSGKVELAREVLPLAPLVSRALEMVQPLIAERQHAVQVEVPPGLHLQADAVRIAQVIANLVANAAKYTEPGGRLQVGAAEEGGQVVLRVRDNGIGLSPEFLPTIFEMFTQSRQSLDRSRGGLGLGLSIVRNIVHLHGGTVEATSAGLGQGTEIAVRLPRADADAGGTAEQPAPAAAQEPRRSLLIVDDNQDAATLLAEVLTVAGHEVRIAFHPDDALRQFGEQRPDIALVDIGLPAMDGYELVRRMRAACAGQPIQFVALTGYGLESDKRKATEAGFDHHFVKPVLPQRLLQLIGAGSGSPPPA